MTKQRPQSAEQLAALVDNIRGWAAELGFQHTGISDTDLGEDEAFLLDWLDAGFHGEMNYMDKHGSKRSHPEELLPGTTRIISVRMDYQPDPSADPESVLSEHSLGYVSRYALGRDYHKLMRHRLQKLADRIEKQIGPFGYRAFVDSAPVLEKAIAQKAGLGWIGKHTNLISENTGSWFFLGEIYTDLPLPTDNTAVEHCGTCTSCIEACPTKAIVAPYKIDARLCISYLTIELRDSIPTELRPLLGNRIYGCDDCQLACPWNRFATPSPETDFLPRHELDSPTLLDLFAWDEQTFLSKTEGSAIRRIGHACWQRNIAVALGNSLRKNPAQGEVITALQASKTTDPMVMEHINWALEQATV